MGKKAQRPSSASDIGIEADTSLDFELLRSSIAPTDSFEHTRSEIMMSQGMRKMLRLRQDLERRGATPKERAQVVHAINVSQPYVRPGSRQRLREAPQAFGLASRGPVRNSYPGLVKHERAFKNYTAAGDRLHATSKFHKQPPNADGLPDQVARRRVDRTLDGLKEDYFPPSRGWSLRNATGAAVSVCRDEHGTLGQAVCTAAVSLKHRSRRSPPLTL